MTVQQYLTFVAELRGVAASDVSRRVREASEKTAVVDVLDAPISSLSHGYRQRVGVAQAIVHGPDLLILDEPTSGLDPVQIVEMRQLIRTLRGQHTVLLSSHNLPEISQTCDRLLIIQEGKIVEQGTEDAIATKLGGAGGQFEPRGAGHGQLAVDALSKVPGVADVTIGNAANGIAHLRVNGTGELRPELVKALVGANIGVLRIDRAGGGDLESIFLKLTHSGGRN